jgi:hypothetical protein
MVAMRQGGEPSLTAPAGNRWSYQPFVVRENYHRALWRPKPALQIRKQLACFRNAGSRLIEPTTLPVE